MRRSWLRLYAPFLAVVAAQALLVTFLPSKAPGQDVATGGDDSGFVAGGGAASPGDVAGGVTIPGAGSTGGSTAGAGGTGGSGGGSIGGGGGIVVPRPGVRAGDRSHCTPDGKQFGVLLAGGPPCQPVFAGNNFGATTQGVTADTIKVVFFRIKPNEQVNAILSTQGLAYSNAEEDAAVAAYLKFVQTHYELYGRKIVLKTIEGNCPTTPPDYDTCIGDARRVVQEKPFAVLWSVQLYADVFDVWANAGILAIGGDWFDVNYYSGRRPYRYDPFSDGTMAANMLAEFYCKNMAGRPADHAGITIHPTIGGRATKRHLGIVVPEVRANLNNANLVQAKVKACTNGADVPVVSSYKSDIEAATVQTQATISKMINSKVTTIACMCDPIAPAFLTTGASQSGYYPEHLIPGIGDMDYDLVGRLYDKQQWLHAFGPSQFPVPVPLDDSDTGRVWRAEGKSGHPCGGNGCGLIWSHFALLGTGLQQAGPRLTPLTFERGILSSPPSGGIDPRTVLAKFGPNDYTALSDAKIIYWNPVGTSPVDGKSQGAYVALDGGRRYQPGQIPSNLMAKIPVR